MATTHDAYRFNDLTYDFSYFPTSVTQDIPQVPQIAINGHVPNPPGRRRRASKGPRFACHFHKHDPATYGVPPYKKTCSGYGWYTIPRLKEHLRRKHYFPNRCDRCGMDFKAAKDLTKHYRSRVPCQISVNPLSEGMTREQEKLLRSRHRGPAEEQWKKIQGDLFPDDDMPSPYVDERQDETSIDDMSLEHTFSSHADEFITTLQQQAPNLPTEQIEVIREICTRQYWDIYQMLEEREASSQFNAFNQQMANNYTNSQSMNSGLQSPYMNGGHQPNNMAYMFNNCTCPQPTCQMHGMGMAGYRNH